MDGNGNSNSRSVSWGGRGRSVTWAGRKRSVTWAGRTLTMVLTVALILPMLMAAPGITSASAASPELTAIAAKTPDANVAIIAQSVGDGQRAMEMVAKLGGEVTKELPIINAFAAEMTAKDAVKLAGSRWLRWVTLDGPVIRTSALADDTVRDEFTPYTYSNNQGTVNWSSNWQEIGEYDGPFYGDIRLMYDALRISDDHRGIQRAVDLSGSSSATLSFDYGLASFDDSYDYVTLQVSADGGANWTELDRYAGPSWGSWTGFQPATYDISSYMSASTVIRFYTSNSLGRYDSLYVDNVEVRMSSDPCPGCPTNTYLDTINVSPAWDMGLKGQGMTIAVIDSGIAPDADFGVILDSRHFGSSTGDDPSGHGTHVAGIIAGNGSDSGQFYQGVAPMANLLSIAISDENGMAYESDAVAALQWVYDNKDVYNIRVVNMSFNTTEEQSYHESPMDAAAEILWFNGVVVVCSVGNKGVEEGPNPANAAPANDPFIITVGASYEQGTADRSDDTIGTFSANARTLDGFDKPEIIAPGKDIYSVLSADSTWKLFYPERTVLDGQYFRLSGTSMSAPMVSAAAALMLQNEPTLTPDQVKYRLMNSGGTIGADQRISYPYLDVYAAVTNTSTNAANTGIPASQLLWSGDDPVAWDSVSWNSVSWNSVSWNSVSWNSVSWNSVSWNSVSWNSVSWND